MNLPGTILIAFLFISCQNNSDNRKSGTNESVIAENKIAGAIIDSNVYEDIDLFKLEGIGEIKHPLNYPYIKIENLNVSEKRITYKKGPTDIVEKLYQKRGMHWSTFSDFKADTGFTRTYEFIAPNKIIELNYYGTYQKTGFHLDDASIFEKNKRITYIFWNNRGSDIGPYLNPDVKNLDLIKNKVNVIVTEEFTKENDILSICSKSFDKLSKEIFDIDTSCFNIGDHSWFWFEKFGQNNKVECK